MDNKTKKLISQTLIQIEYNIKTLRSLLAVDSINATNVEDSNRPEYPEIDNLLSRYDEWPKAVDDKLIIKSDGTNSSKQLRAMQIVDYINIPKSSKIILDCGCGEGHIAIEIANRNMKVVGYDIVQDPLWDNLHHNNLTITSNKQIVIDNGPFDFIILYDVIDHIINENPSKFIVWLSSLLTENGIIYVRAHPWVSRTGGHLYTIANKAFIHLALTKDQFARFDETNLKLVRPMEFYTKWFENAQLDIISINIDTSHVEPFFSGEILDHIIDINWGAKNISHERARTIMANHFINYKIKHKK